MVEIKNRYTGVVIYTHSGDTLSDADLTGIPTVGLPLTGIGGNLSDRSCLSTWPDNTNTDTTTRSM